MDVRDVVISPIITEKSNDLLASEGKYTFRVNLHANKHQIRNAIEQIFDVTVTQVNTSRQVGKLRRMGRHEGRKPDWKKAIVSLKEGQRIDAFEGM